MNSFNFASFSSSLKPKVLKCETNDKSTQPFHSKFECLLKFISLCVRESCWDYAVRFHWKNVYETNEISEKISFCTHDCVSGNFSSQFSYHFRMCDFHLTKKAFFPLTVTDMEEFLYCIDNRVSFFMLNCIHRDEWLMFYWIMH